MSVCAVKGCPLDAQEVVGVDLRVPSLKISGEAWAFEEATFSVDVCNRCCETLKGLLMVVEVERFLSGRSTR